MKRTLATLAVAALLLTGCTDDPTTASTSADSAAGRSGTEAGGGGGQVLGAPQDPAAKDALVPLGRVAPATDAVVRTGDLAVVVEDVDVAAEEAARLVRAARGRVEADERARDGAPERARDGGPERARDRGPDRATLRLRIPPGAFDATVGRLAGLGEETSRRLGSDVVTDQVVDLDSRLATQRASVARVRALLADAKTLGEVVQVEAELTRRTADLESLEARLGALTAQVDLGTLELSLTTAGPVDAAGGPPGFRDGLRHGLDALQAVGRAFGVAAGALLPWSPVLLGAGLLLWRARRRTT